MRLLGGGAAYEAYLNLSPEQAGPGRLLQPVLERLPRARLTGFGVRR
jgi:hypothetical protein